MAILLTGTATANAASTTVHNAGTLMFATDTGELRIADGTNTWSTLPDKFKLAPIASPTFTGTVDISSLANYASNAAAITGGLATGDVYRNGDNLCVVH